MPNTLCPSEMLGYYRAITIKDIKQAPRKTRLFFFTVWIMLSLLCVGLGILTVKLNWSGIPVYFGGAQFAITIYPPLTICFLMSLWFGFWWGAIPAYISTFILSLYFQMSPAWAALFAFSDPIAFAVLVVGYRVMLVSLSLRSVQAILPFVVLTFLGSILSSIGTFIWSHTGHLSPQATMNIWQGWWVGLTLQNFFTVGPLLGLFSLSVSRWRDSLFPRSAAIAGLNQRGLLMTMILFLSGVYLFILLSVTLSKNVASSVPVNNTTALLQQLAIQRETTGAVYLVIGILFFSFAYLGYFLIINWNEKLLKAIADAERANAAKAAFLARMSHEIRTPMNAIIGLSELALQKAKEPRQKDYLSKIRTSSSTLLHLINDVLDFSKSDAGKLKLEKRLFNLEEVINRVSDQIAFRIADKDIAFDVEISAGIPAQIEGDSIKLEQVLLNLLGNACKFTNQGVITLQVSNPRLKDDQLELRFSVTDTGIGIPRHRQAGLFQPFMQADESITRQYGGTGLGLAICKQVVEAMGGEIWIDHQMTIGSSFVFTAQFTVTDDATVICQQAEKIILVLMETPSTRLTTLSYLHQMGHRAIVCDNRFHLLEIVDAESVVPDYIFIEMEGEWRADLHGLTKLLRPSTGETIPTILLSAPLGSKVDIELDDLDRTNVFLMNKPVLPSKLALVMQQACTASPRADRRRSDKRLVLQADSHQAYRTLYHKRVLIVEDEPINRQIAEELLGDIGVITDSAGDGMEALQKVRHSHFDAVLMDIHMPIMDGISAAIAIRESGDTSLPIIALTAHAIKEVSHLPPECGFSDLLGKPYIPIQLFEVLAKHIKVESSVDQTEWFSEIPGEGRRIRQTHTGNKHQALHLPGIDLEKGMKTVGLAPDRYFNILAKFEQHHGDTPSKVWQAFQDNNLKEVHRIAHSMKSVSRSIGAERLCLLAELLEQAATAHYVTEQQVRDFADALEEVIQSLATIGE